MTAPAAGRYPRRVKRLELTRIRVCDRCGRGGAELRAASGEVIVVPLDPVRTAQLRDGASQDSRFLADLVLDALRAGGATVSEVVLELSQTRLGALVSILRGSEPEVVACTAEEAVALAVRGGVRIYATEEALAHGSARTTKAVPHGGAGGPDTVH